MSQLLIPVFFLLYSFSLFAQPGNNLCTSPSTLTNLDGCVTGTTAGATFDTYRGNCMDATGNVWYRFTAQGPQVNLTLTGANGSRPQMALISPVGGPCDASTNLQVACNTGSGNWNSVSLSSGILTPGNEYYIIVANASNGTAGAFTLCIDNPPPPPPSGTQDCVDATPICSTTPFSGNSNGFGGQELDESNRGCLGSNENNSSWFFFTAATSGTLTFTISPQSTDDYDFAVWGPDGNCPPTVAPTRCSWAQYPRSGTGANACGTNNPETGLILNATETTQGACATGVVRHLDVLAGETYILLVDGFTPTPSPFEISFGGTASLDCTILSMDLLHFSGKPVDSKHALEWETKREANSSHAVVERSFDAERWQSLGELASSGWTNSPTSYSFSAAIEGAQTHYYRLRIIDLNGREDFSQILALDGRGSRELFALQKIYPQPSSGNFFIEYQAGDSKKLSLEIYSSQGALVHKQAMQETLGRATEEVQLDFLATGLYLVVLRNEEGKTQREKILIRKD